MHMLYLVYVLYLGMPNLIAGGASSIIISAKEANVSTSKDILLVKSPRGTQLDINKERERERKLEPNLLSLLWAQELI